MPILWRALPWLVLAALAILDLSLLATPVRALFAHVPINYNEGWNAFHTLRLRTGGTLYPPVSPDVFINYPPLSFYVVAALEPLVGDDIFAGRLVALLALGVVTLNVGLLARLAGASRMLSATAATAFFGFVAIYYADYVAMDDPQWLGHALQTSGLIVLLRRHRYDVGTLLAVAVLLLAGGLVKQTLVVLPLAVTLWLALEDRRALVRWLLLCAALTAASLAACLALWGQSFVDQVLLSERSLWRDGLAFLADGLAARLAPFVLFAAIGVASAWRGDRRARLLGLYLAIGLAVGLLLLAIRGVSYSALFDLTIAMMLGAALLFEWLSRRLALLPALAPARHALPVAVFALPLLAASPHALDNQSPLRNDLARQAVWTGMIEQLAAASGPVACETLALCYWAGVPSAIDFFNFGQAAMLHPDGALEFGRGLEAHRLALIEEDEVGGSRRLPQTLNDLVAASYAATAGGPVSLLAPR